MSIEKFASIILFFLILQSGLLILYFVLMEINHIKLINYLKNNYKHVYFDLTNNSNILEIFKFKRVRFLFNDDNIEDNNIKLFKSKIKSMAKMIVIVLISIFLTFLISGILGIIFFRE